MAETWKHSQLALLKHYPEKGAQWVMDECNKIPGAPWRTLHGVRRKARKLGYLTQAEPMQTTDHIDAAIRRAYLSGQQGAAARCAKACNRPMWWVVKRARELKLRPLRGRIFNPIETACIAANAHLPPSEIQVKLKRLGYTRTAQSIRLFIAKNDIEADRDQPLSARQTAELFGVDVETLLRHVRSGRLIARRAGEGGQSSPSVYLIEPKQIARFVILHPQLIDLRKVDPIWFIDMLAQHAAAASHDMHRNRGVRLAQMVRENPDISPELVADMLGISEFDAIKRLSEARRDTMREAA